MPERNTTDERDLLTADGMALLSWVYDYPNVHFNTSLVALRDAIVRQCEAKHHESRVLLTERITTLTEERDARPDERAVREKVAMLFEAWRELAGELVPHRDDPESDARLRTMESNDLDAYAQAVRDTERSAWRAAIEGMRRGHENWCDSLEKESPRYSDGRCTCCADEVNAALAALAERMGTDDPPRDAQPARLSGDPC